ncbi:MalM family protein [Klebsiella pneumoniae]|nr:MalM family protein [Klebsiella pneumoniae]
MSRFCAERADSRPEHDARGVLPQQLLYQQPGVMTADRLGGVMRLTPALGQQKLYVLVFTTEKISADHDPAGSGENLCQRRRQCGPPGIPDPIAKHTTDGVLKLKVKTNSTSSVLVGPLFGSSGPGPVTVGNTAAPVAAPAAAAAPAAKSEPMLSDTETYFNNGIKQAVKQGDIDKALKLMNEAERLGSKSARSTFISSVKGKG